MKKQNQTIILLIAGIILVLLVGPQLGLFSVADKQDVYQENANEISCSGSWRYSGCPKTYDGDWDTYSDAYAGSAYLYVNYTKPLGAFSTSLWKVKDATGIYTLDFSGFEYGDSEEDFYDCWNYDSTKLILRVKSYFVPSPYVNWECYDNLGWRVMDSKGYISNDRVYEEAMIWVFLDRENPIVDKYEQIYEDRLVYQEDADTTCVGALCDGDWDSYDNVMSTNLIYNIPEGATSNSIWKVKGEGIGTRNLPLGSCWDINADIIKFRVSSEALHNNGRNSWACYDRDGKYHNLVLSSTGNNKIYEEAMVWAFPDNKIPLFERFSGDSWENSWGASSVYSNRYIYQTFTVGGNGMDENFNLKSVSLFVDNVGIIDVDGNIIVKSNSQNIKVEIREVDENGYPLLFDNTGPNGPAISSGTKIVEKLDEGNWINIDVSPIILEKSIKYAIVLSSTINIWNEASVFFADGDGTEEPYVEYPFGWSGSWNQGTQASTGRWLGGTSQDLFFQLFGTLTNGVDENGIPTNGNGNGNGINGNGNGDVNGNGEIPSFSLNQVLFKIGDFNVTILILLITIGGLFILKVMFSKKK